MSLHHTASITCLIEFLLVFWKLIIMQKYFYQLLAQYNIQEFPDISNTSKKKIIKTILKKLMIDQLLWVYIIDFSLSLWFPTAALNKGDDTFPEFWPDYVGSTNWLASSVTEQIAGQQIQHILLFVWTEIIIRTLMVQWRNNSQSRGFDPHTIIIIFYYLKWKNYSFISSIHSTAQLRVEC